ncbi:hypothetical protein HFO61_03890 [Rhizobium leguminosarum]|uniref:hypothetical protein n=1 Tax=Rhizobium leguminosarum TaxID=384 RepID=UPI001C969C4F|nr:hypothetical protein [Rhizobium leguminosarum]MBY5545989.1 hypothetical protein [Rhizobium leguminosarum]
MLEQNADTKGREPIVALMLNDGRVCAGFRNALFEAAGRSGLTVNKYLVVECKNWQALVDTATVRAFTSKLRFMGMKFGRLVAANRVTGSQVEVTACHA